MRIGGEMNPVEYIGLTASLFIMVSMCFPTNTFKATLLLRIFNLVGSIIFLVYGIMLPAISTAVLNGVNVVVNSVQTVLLFVKKKKDEENSLDKENNAENVEDNLIEEVEVEGNQNILDEQE